MFTVKVLYAIFTKDHDIFEPMDPFIVLRYGSQQRQSTIKFMAGMSATWNQSFNFQLENATQLMVAAWDKDTITKDDLIGRGNLNLVVYFREPGLPHYQSVEVYEDRPKNPEMSGRVIVEITTQGTERYYPKAMVGYEKTQYQNAVNNYNNRSQLAIPQYGVPLNVAPYQVVQQPQYAVQTAMVVPPQNYVQVGLLQHLIQPNPYY